MLSAEEEINLLSKRIQEAQLQQQKSLMLDRDLWEWEKAKAVFEWLWQSGYTILSYRKDKVSTDMCTVVSWEPENQISVGVISLRKRC